MIVLSLVGIVTFTFILPIFGAPSIEPEWSSNSAKANCLSSYIGRLSLRRRRRHMCGLAERIRRDFY